MSAFGTKKPGANAAEDLTYPTLFATHYAATNNVREPMTSRNSIPVQNDLREKKLAMRKAQMAETAAMVNSPIEVALHPRMPVRPILAKDARLAYAAMMAKARTPLIGEEFRGRQKHILDEAHQPMDSAGMIHQLWGNQARQIVRNGLQARRTADEVFLGGYNAAIQMPQPLLTYRVRGTNFGEGFGANMDYPSTAFHKPMPEPVNWNVRIEPVSEMRGGILASPQSRTYIQKFKQRRKAELDAIAASHLDTGIFKAQEENIPGINSAERLEIVTLFKQLEAQIVKGENAIGQNAFETGRKLALLIFKYAGAANDRYELGNDFRDYIEFIDSLLEDIQAYTSIRARVLTEDARKGGFFFGLKLLLEKLREFVVGIYEKINLSMADRKLLAASLIKSLKFNEIPGATMNVRKLKKEALDSFTGVDDLAVVDDEQAELQGASFSRAGVSAERSNGPQGEAYFSHDQQIDFGRQLMPGGIARRANMGEGVPAQTYEQYSLVPSSASLAEAARGPAARATGVLEGRIAAFKEANREALMDEYPEASEEDIEAALERMFYRQEELKASRGSSSAMGGPMPGSVAAALAAPEGEEEEEEEEEEEQVASAAPGAYPEVQALLTSMGIKSEGDARSWLENSRYKSKSGRGSDAQNMGNAIEALRQANALAEAVGLPTKKEGSGVKHQTIRKDVKTLLAKIAQRVGLPK